MLSLLHAPFYGLGRGEKRVYDGAVELLGILHALTISSLSSPHFGRPGLLVALLGEPAHLHLDLESLLGELVRRELLVTELPLTDTNLLSGLVHACLGSPEVGATIVLPSALCVPDPSGRTLLGHGGPLHLVGIRADRQADARLLAQNHHVPLWPLGRTTGQELVIRLSEGPPEEPFPTLLRMELGELRQRRLPP